MATMLKEYHRLPELTLKVIETPGLHCGFYRIYPDIARELIEKRNPTNRSIKSTKISQLICDIRNGNFALNGETIIFSDTGHLLNGQHRLTAVIEADMSITTLVVTGIHSLARRTMDQGKMRGAGDVLHMETDTTNGNVLAAILRGFIAYNTGDKTSFGRTNAVSRATILQAQQDYPEIGVIAEWAVQFKNTVRGVTSATQIGIARSILEPVYGEEVIYFLERIAQGDGIEIDSPAFAVRRRLMSNGRATLAFGMECIMRGAIAYMEGRKLNHVKLEGRLPLLRKAML